MYWRYASFENTVSNMSELAQDESSGVRVCEVASGLVRRRRTKDRVPLTAIILKIETTD